MKLRIRWNNTTKIVEITDENTETYTLHDLKSAIESKFDNALLNYQLSLNKKDILEDESVRLKELGLVSGDSLYILCDSVPHVVYESKPNQPEVKSEPDSHEEKTIGTPYSTDKVSEKPPCTLASAQTTESRVLETANSDSHSMETDACSTCTSAHVDPAIVNRYLNEPLLCSDSTESAVPCMLEQIFKSTECQNNHEAIFIVLHVMFLESGFLVVDKNDGAQAAVADSSVEKSGSLTLPSDWKNDDGRCYKLSYTHRTCDSLLTCSLTAVPMGGNLLVYGKMNGEYSEPFQLQLTSRAYVNDALIGKSQEACTCYRNLSKLSRLFKDCIVLPLVQSLRSESGLADIDGLMGLPFEIKLRIFAFLNVRSLMNIIQTCKEFQILGQDRSLWRALHLRAFGGRSVNDLNQDWYKMYKTEYCRRLEWRRMTDRTTILADPPNYWGYPNPSNPVAPPTFGMIGGDYDLNPNFHFIPDPVFGQHRQGRPHGPFSLNQPRPRFFPTGPIPGNPRPRMPRGPFGGFGF